MEEINVIIPLYNSENYIKESVLSVISQPYKNINIIIVDDGSTDSSNIISQKLVNEYPDRIHLIYQENSGVSSARNTGIDYVLKNKKGYISFLDSYDKWNCDFFDKTLLDNYFVYGYEIIGFQSVRCNSSMTRCTNDIMLNDGLYKGSEQTIWMHSTQHLGSLFFSCGFLSKYKLTFLENLKNNEDRIFSMQSLYLADSILLKNKIMYLYRNNPFSVSHKTIEPIKKYVPMINEYIRLDISMKKYGFLKKGEFHEGTKMAAVYLLDMIDEYFSEHNDLKFIQNFFETNTKYKDIFKIDFVINDRIIKRRMNSINKNFSKYVVKRRFIGIYYLLKKSIYYILLFFHMKWLTDRMRYPLQLSQRGQVIK